MMEVGIAAEGKRGKSSAMKEMTMVGKARVA
jgi:hypothetical protein